MKITVTAKDARTASFYNNEDCPIARAMKRAGFRDVIVGEFCASVGDGSDRKYLEFNAELQEISARLARGTFTEDRTVEI